MVDCHRSQIFFFRVTINFIIDNITKTLFLTTQNVSVLLTTRKECLGYIHTDKSKATPNFFGDTVFEVAERNMWVMEIKYFEF